MLCLSEQMTIGTPSVTPRINAWSLVHITSPLIWRRCSLRQTTAAMCLPGSPSCPVYSWRTTTREDIFSRITDTLMNQIKESSTPSSNHQPINSNSFGRVNKTFACFVIDFLVVQLVFNNWFPFKCQNAPSPYARNIEPEAKMDVIQTNQKILIL
jgi:hypothetical protein